MIGPPHKQFYIGNLLIKRNKNRWLCLWTNGAGRHSVPFPSTFFTRYKMNDHVSFRAVHFSQPTDVVDIHFSHGERRQRAVVTVSHDHHRSLSSGSSQPTTSHQQINKTPAIKSLCLSVYIPATGLLSRPQRRSILVGQRYQRAIQSSITNVFERFKCRHFCRCSFLYIYTDSYTIASTWGHTWTGWRSLIDTHTRRLMIPNDTERARDLRWSVAGRHPSKHNLISRSFFLFFLVSISRIFSPV